jgi:hypothetical protein
VVIILRKKFGGRVFIVFSVKVGKKKMIKNLEVIDEIKNEIEKIITSYPISKAEYERENIRYFYNSC